MCFELSPYLPTKWALMLAISHIKPLDDAVHMEGMVTLSPNWRTIITRKLAIWTTRVEGLLADATDILTYVP